MTDNNPALEVKRTRLEWARDVARAYRWALLKADPEKCARLDIEARKAGQRWIAPEYLPPEAMEEAAAKVLPPSQLALLASIPVGTIYSWISRGLLKPVPSEEAGPARYAVRDALALDARRKARRVDSA